MSMELQAREGRHDDDGDASRQSSWKGGDAEVNAVKAVVDVEERRRRSRGRRGRNGRVDAEVDAVKPPVRRGVGWVCQSQQRIGDESTRRCCQYRAYKVEGPNHGDAVDVVVLDEEEAVRECESRCIGEQGSATMRGVRPASMAQRWRG